MTNRRIGRKVALAAGIAGLVTAVSLAPAEAAPPSPVYAPAGGVADPGLLNNGENFYAFATGSRAPVHKGEIAAGPWSSLGPALAAYNDDKRKTWATDAPIWAPDAVHTDAGYVLYFSARAKRPAGSSLDPEQRCIGVAVSPTVDGPYKSLSERPLVCPSGSTHDGEDQVPGRPVAGAGVIDPSPFRAADGKRYVLYKTQQMPSSLRMLRLTDNGTHAFTADTTSAELVQRDGIIENPVMLQRGSDFVLFASRHGYDNCSYASVWLRSTNRWSFAGATEHNLLTSGGTGICGPGGADVVPSLDGGWRIFLHGWVCGGGTRPCTAAQAPFPGNDNARRVLYAAILNWNGSTPSVGAFL